MKYFPELRKDKTLFSMDPQRDYISQSPSQSFLVFAPGNTLSRLMPKQSPGASLLALLGAIFVSGVTVAAQEAGPYKSPGKAVNAYGPLFSESVPHTNAEEVSSSDFVETVRVPDGSEVRVLVKAPAPASPGKIMHVAPIAAGITANTYFARAITEAMTDGYGTVVFPKGTYSFAAPTSANSSHLVIKSVHDLTIDGQGSTLNFASPLAGGVTISGSQRILFRDFNIDWPVAIVTRLADETLPQVPVDA